MKERGELLPNVSQYGFACGLLPDALYARWHGSL